MDFHQIIKARLAELNISPAQLSMRSGVSPTSVYKFMWGSDCTAKTLAKFFDILDLEVKAKQNNLKESEAK